MHPASVAGSRALSKPTVGRPAVHRSQNSATIANMAIFQFFMALLEIMFFIGLAGSSIVVIISFIEDGKELFGKD